MIRFWMPRTGAALFFALLPLSSHAEQHVDLNAGRTIFNETAVPNCAICHSLSDAGAEGEIGPNLDDFKPTADQVRAAVTSGIGVMPSFSETLSEAEIETVATYVAAVTGGDQSTDATPMTDEIAEPGADSTGAMLAMGDPTAGEKVFRKCMACHSVAQDGANKGGPNLYGIGGAPVAAVADFRYSDAMKDHGGDWTPERLSTFLASPRKDVPGTKMGFAGLRDEQDRADVIAYLNSQSEAQQPAN